MKKLVLLIVALIFAANTITVAAWAKPCMRSTDPAAAHHMQGPDADELPPCHDMQKKDKQSGHCEGGCQCLHFSFTHVPLIQDTGEIFMPVASSYRFWLTDEQMASVSLLPLRRPPKSLS